MMMMMMMMVFQACDTCQPVNGSRNVQKNPSLRSSLAFFSRVVIVYGSMKTLRFPVAQWQQTIGSLKSLAQNQLKA